MTSSVVEKDVDMKYLTGTSKEVLSALVKRLDITTILSVRAPDRAKNRAEGQMCGRGGAAGDPSGVAWEQAGGCRKEWRMVHALFDVKRRGRQEDQKFGGRKKGASGQD